MAIIAKQKQFFLTAVSASIVAGLAAGGLAGYFISKEFLARGANFVQGETQILAQEEAVTKVVERVEPSVVSIIVTKDLPVIEQYWQEYDPFERFRNFFENPFGEYPGPGYQQQEQGTEKVEVGGGTGFIISEDGLILTNKHVVLDQEAEYTVLTNEGEKYEAKVLARDPIQDVAILEIDKKNLPILSLGNSDELKVGQTVIAIGNALGEFRNTVSVGVVSGRMRSITATNNLAGQSENLEGVIQTDAAINPGNSGGPLLNLEGKVIGINVAIVSGAQNIAFSVPINNVKRSVEQVKATGKISYAYLGIRYAAVTAALAQQNNLSVDYGALIVGGEQSGESAVEPGSPADRAGLKQNDIILEIDGQRIDEKNSLAKIIQSKNVGQRVTLKILRGNEQKTITAVLGERE